MTIIRFRSVIGFLLDTMAPLDLLTMVDISTPRLFMLAFVTHLYVPLLGIKELMTDGNLMLLFVSSVVMSLHLEAMFKVLVLILILTVLDLLTKLELICVRAMTQVACHSSYFLETFSR